MLDEYYNIFINPCTKIFVNGSNIANNNIYVFDNSPVINADSRIAMIRMHHSKILNMTNWNYIEKVFIIETDDIRSIIIRDNQDLKVISYDNYNTYYSNYYGYDYLIDNSIVIENCNSLRQINGVYTRVYKLFILKGIPALFSLCLDLPQLDYLSIGSLFTSEFRIMNLTSLYDMSITVDRNQYTELSSIPTNFAFDL